MSDHIELATILLTDLVGSTRLATAVGPVRHWQGHAQLETLAASLVQGGAPIAG